ncbi:thioredoxin family protein [Paenibacillus puldeungensis]|uniref:Thioredoxin family protein n=1 Tax=Paenibacillus puldeungensis TaxID=696536 RepID=A0ABW3RV52_9BACL
MTLREISENEWLSRGNNTREALYLFTPMCGTCKLGEKMLEIALASGPCIPVFGLNINYAPTLREAWQISSVPCLVIVQEGQPVQIEYAMRSVVDLYTWLKV